MGVFRMAKIEIGADKAKISNYDRQVIYDYDTDKVLIPSYVVDAESGEVVVDQVVISDGICFLASCTALFGSITLKVMED